MPKHKIQKQDEITTAEWTEILQTAENLKFANAYQVPPFQLWLSAVIVIDWLTGKRINEILSLKRRHITFTRTHIKIKFFVGKKHSRSGPLTLMPYQKTRNIKHKAVPYIQAYLAEFDKAISNQDNYLFPADTKPRQRKVRTSFINGRREKETRTYIYNDPGGYVYEENARFWLKKINEQLPPEKRLYFHYGRHNIGIKLAYQGKTPYDIAQILDTTERTALNYTKHAGGYGQEWTNETE